MTAIRCPNPECHSYDIIGYGSKDGKPAYKCKRCNRIFRITTAYTKDTRYDGGIDIFPP